MTDNDLLVLKNKEILVTGGCGFIGSEIVKQLSALEANVTVLDNLSSGKKKYVENFPNVKIQEGEQGDIDLTKSLVSKKDYIINLAALPFIPDSFHYPKEFFDVNVNSTINLALIASKEKSVKRLVHISSSEVYGSARYVPMDENHPTIPQSTYAVSKLAGERVIYTMSREHQIPAVIIRPFNSFGPNITQPYIIPEIISQLLKNDNKLTLGNIQSSRDLTFVSDTANAIIISLVAEGVIGETINVGSGRALTVSELVDNISTLMNKDDVSIQIDNSRFRPHDVDKLVCNSDRAKSLLNWVPKTSISDGLQKTIDWIKENGITFMVPFKGWTSTYRKNWNDDNNET